MKDKELDVLAIHETPVDESVPVHSIAIQGYNWISKNRNRSGGGIRFFVNDLLHFQVRAELRWSNTKKIFCYRLIL